MSYGEESLDLKQNITLAELVKLTQNFLKLADTFYESGKINQEEYTELTFLKKNFLTQVEKYK